MTISASLTTDSPMQQSIFEAPSQATLTDQDSVIDRDMRLTGKFRAQTDHPEAPLGFEVNNPWKVGNASKRCRILANWGASLRIESNKTLTERNILS